MSKAIQISGGALLVHDAGRGVPILFVHGFPLDHTMWRAQLEALPATHRVIAPDLRGFGGSAPTSLQTSEAASAAPYTMEQHADDLAQLLDELAIDEPVIYCALSMGGYVGWQFLRKHPQRVRALIQCDTRSSADNAQGAEVRRKLAEQVLIRGSTLVAEQMPTKLFAPDTFAKRPAIVEQVKAMILATPPTTIAAAQLGMAARPDMGDWLATIRVPTLLICGEHDSLTTPDVMRADAERIVGARFVTIPDAGHMAPMENPVAVTSAIQEFLAAL